VGKGCFGLPRDGDPYQAAIEKGPEYSQDQAVDQRGMVQPEGRSPGGQAPAGVEAADYRRLAVLQPIDQSQVNGSALRWLENGRYLLGRCVKIKQI
jgi:hypothetical protein